MPSPCILIVEDDAHLRKTLHDILALKGYTPVSAASGQAALAAAQSQVPAAAVVGLKLTDGSGLEVLKCIRVQYPDLPVVLVTAYPEEMAPIVEAAQPLNVYAYLCKPFKIEALLQILADTALRHALS